jgi:hypothetical protein
LLGVIWLLFGDVFLAGGSTVVSNGQDLYRQNAYWRQFAFHELRHGHLPLWNPHIFCGAPFLAGWQSALLYPLNWLFIVLPLPTAINVSVALHLYILGLGIFLWIWRRGISPVGAGFGAVMVMCGSAVMLHLRAGHLPHLCEMAWAPWLLLAIDGLVRKPSLGWVLAGAGAAAMQVLAGHPQYIFYSAITAALYALLQLVRAPAKWKTVKAILAFGLLAAAVTAAQWLPALAAVRETTRSRPLPFSFVGSYALPIENLLTAIAPGFFGNNMRLIYWGRWYCWEVSLFVGVIGLAMALYGACNGERRQRVLAGTMALVLVLLALGPATPLLKLFYWVVPGLDRFRCPARFTFYASLFAALLAAIGVDHLLREKTAGRRAAWIGLAVAALLAGTAFAVRHSGTEPTGAWTQWVMTLSRDGQSETREMAGAPGFAQKAAEFASHGLFVAAVMTALWSAGMFLRRAGRIGAYALVCVGLVELVGFAHDCRGTFNLRAILPTSEERAVAAHLDGARLFNITARSDAGMLGGWDDIWGYDSFQPGRYTEFMAFTQGKDPDAAVDDLQLTHWHPLYSMLRCRFVIVPGPAGDQAREVPGALGRLVLVRDFKVAPGRDGIFAAMADPAFDPAQTVILESPPGVAPVAPPHGRTASPGEVKLLESGTDELTIDAQLYEPAILLVTDGYAAGWRVTPLAADSQQRMKVMPADYIFRAVPLQAGHHLLRMEYAPAGFAAGQWVSLVSLVLFFGLAVRWMSGCSRRALEGGASVG